MATRIKDRQSIINKNISIINSSTENRVIEQKIMQANVADKQGMGNTNMMNFAGVLTPITFFSQYGSDSNVGDMINIDGPSDMAYDGTAYIRINKLEVKFKDEISLDDENDEHGHSYIHNGSIQFLPNTIRPKENDYFILEFQNRRRLYRITSVTVDSISGESAISAEFANSDKDFEVGNHEDAFIFKHVIREFDFVREHYGTGYRCLMESGDLVKLTKIKDLYKFLGKIYFDEFYNSNYNIYELGSFNNEFDFVALDYKKNAINNDILIEKGNSIEEYPISVVDGHCFNKYYDENLAYFIRDHKIFMNIGSLNMFMPSDLLPWSESNYSKTIYKALETQNSSRFINKRMIVRFVSKTSPATHMFLYHKYIVDYVSGTNGEECRHFLHPAIEETLNKETDYLNNIPFVDKKWVSYSNLIAETIGMYIKKCNIDVILDHILYLCDNKDQLYVSDIGVFPHNAYYLYPMLGYIIGKIAETKFSGEINNY